MLLYVGGHSKASPAQGTSNYLILCRLLTVNMAQVLLPLPELPKWHFEAQLNRSSGHYASVADRGFGISTRVPRPAKEWSTPTGDTWCLGLDGRDLPNPALIVSPTGCNVTVGLVLSPPFTSSRSSAGYHNP